MSRTLRFLGSSSLPILMPILMLWAAGPAGATTFTDAAIFDAAYPGATLIDFEGIAPAGGTAAVPVFPGITLNVPSSFVASSTYPDGLSPCPCPSDFLWQDQFGGGGLIAFDAPTSAVGFLLAAGNSTGIIRVSVLDATFTPLAPPVDVVATDLTDFSTFIGFDGVGPIEFVLIDVLGSLNWLNLDDIRHQAVIPEPATALLLLAGVAGLALRRADPPRP